MIFSQSIAILITMLLLGLGQVTSGKTLLKSNLENPKSSVLKGTEDHYRKAHTITMDVEKILNLKLLQKEKHSLGLIKIKSGGKLRWETLKPEHSLIVINSKVVWMVDYPSDPDEKITVLKANHPKKSQPQALVAFLIGQGRIGDSFKIKSELKKAEKTEIQLVPKSGDDPFHWLKLVIDSKAKTIEKVYFEDAVGNLTELDFSKIIFDSEIDGELFKFSPPKNSQVTVID
jgi:outer membrane lipoprotein-sorting protein